MKDKMGLRKEIRELKRLQSAEHLQTESENIMSLLEMHERFQKAHVVLAYYALPDEPATSGRLEEWRKTKKVLLPVVEGDYLLIREYVGKDSLAEGAFHIMEPTGPVFTAFETIDLVVVPGVAFDGQRHRLGRGKGYYDRLLSLPAFQHCYKLGICFAFQKVAEVPVEANDILMDEVL